MRHPQPDIEELLKAAAADQPPPVASPSEKDASWARMRELLDANAGGGPPAGGGVSLWMEAVVLLGAAAVFAWMQVPLRPAETETARMEEPREVREASGSAAEEKKLAVDSFLMERGSWGDDSMVLESENLVLRQEEKFDDPALRVEWDKTFAEPDRRLPGRAAASGRSVSGKKAYRGPRGISYARRKIIREKDENPRAGKPLKNQVRHLNPDKYPNTAGSRKQRSTTRAGNKSRTGSNAPLNGRKAANGYPAGKAGRSHPAARYGGNNDDTGSSNRLSRQHNARNTSKPQTPQPESDTHPFQTSSPQSQSSNITTNNPAGAPARFHLAPLRMQWRAIGSGLRVAAGRQVAGTAPRSGISVAGDGFSLRLATSISSGSAFGAGLFVEYAVQLGGSFLLRPYAGVQLLTGKEQEYQLPYYKPTSRDSANRHRADSGYTRFTLRNSSYAIVGLPLAFNIRKWEISTGMAAHIRMGQRGAQQTLSDTIPSLFDPQKETPDFRRGSVPGRFGLSWQAGADYRLSPQWHIGAQYQLRFAESATTAKFTLQPAQPHPGKHQFSIHLRHCFGKK